MYSWLSEEPQPDDNPRIDFFDDFLAPVGEINVQGYNFDSANDFFSFSELDRDVYAIAASKPDKKRRKKCKEKKPEPEEALPEIEEFVASPSVITEKFAPKPDSWQDMLLYGLAGLSLILVLEQVFQLGKGRRL